MATASDYKRKFSNQVGTTAAQIGMYAVGNGKSAVVKTIRITVRKVVAQNFTVDGWFQDASGVKNYFCEAFPLKPGNIYLPIGPDGLEVMEEGDSLWVQCSIDGAVDVRVSLMEDAG